MQAGVYCEAYHAGLKPEKRSKVLADWTSGVPHKLLQTCMGCDRLHGRARCMTIFKSFPNCKHVLPVAVNGRFSRAWLQGQPAERTICTFRVGLDLHSTSNIDCKGSVQEKCDVSSFTTRIGAGKRRKHGYGR